jgi:hypothetical protein
MVLTTLPSTLGTTIDRHVLKSKVAQYPWPTAQPSQLKSEEAVM